MFAAMALGEIGDPRAIDGLGVLLKDEDWEDRGAAAVALGQIRSPKAVPLLIEALEDEDRSVRQDASLALAEIRTPGVTEALISVVKSTPRSTDVPLTVIEALGEIGDPRAVEAILSVVPSFMDLWNWCALVALRDIEKQTSDEADEQKLENIMMMFQTSPPDAMEELFGLLDHGNWAMKKEAMKSLMMVGGLSVAPQMEERLNHKNSDIRMLAASWFAMAAEPGSPLSETLIKTFKSKDPAVRRFAILGNDDRTDEAFIKICTEALKDEDYVVRILALRILDEHNIPELEQTVEEGRKAEPEWIQAYIEQLKKQL
jgi:HEAT repeat protein